MIFINILAGISILFFLVFGLAAARSSEENAKVYGKLALLSFALFALTCGFWVVEGAQNVAQNQARNSLAREYEVSPENVELTDILCETMMRGSCVTWSANYKVGGKTGWIKFSTQSSQIKPDGK